MPDVIEVLADLVAIPSINPMGAGAVGDQFGEARMADYVEGFMQRHGIPCERRAVMPGRENVLARVDGQQGGPSVLFETHMDTVRAENMEIDPFEPVQRQGRLYGRGSCDAKASLAAMLVALVEAAGKPPPGDVWLCAAVDEEYTFGGAAHLVASGFRTDYALVGEPTNLQVVTAHKGTVRWRVITRGRSAHAATPWEGENAIYRMARIVTALEAWADELQEAPPHPRLGPRTLNVGTIEGGQTVNTVPDRCVVAVDRRALPGEDLREVSKSMSAHLERLGLGNGVEVEQMLVDIPMELADDSPWAQAVLSAAQRVGPAETCAVHYGTDASKFADVGIPSVVVGPGDIAQAHTANEWVEIEQVRRAVEFYQHVLRAPPP